VYEFWLKPSEKLDNWIIARLVQYSESVLRFFSVEVRNHLEVPWNIIQPINSIGVWIAPSCDGLQVMAVFGIFITVFPGKAISKLWFIPLGLILLFLMNVVRIVSLVLIAKINPHWLQFNHDYTFMVVVYGLVFFLWYWWIQISNFRNNEIK
jgi:exosortase/archaeosortase family protein